MHLYTTTTAAAALSLTAAAIRYHALRGSLRGIQHGRDWLFTEADLASFRRTRRPPGRPPSHNTSRRANNR
ncbi:MAG: hypothetical protein EWM72_02758 [Nitrospira sp.]|nr:MAG: hypothetical protein EWM72_02758 [Nitrospira sp.]